MSEERQTGREDRLAQGDGSVEIEAPASSEDTAAAGAAAATADAPAPDAIVAVEARPSGRARLTRWWGAASPNLRGSAYYDKGEYDIAIADFNDALRIGPPSGIVFHNRGTASGRGL